VSIDFTYGAYQGLLEFIGSELGRPIVPLRDAPDEGPCVILRHDIDYSIEKAVRLAEIEQQAGAHATVFVLMTCEYYNMLMPENLAAARTIASMGHEIGLHYDTGALRGSTPDEQVAEITRLARVLEDHVGVPVASVAQHNPSMTSVRPNIPGYRDAYDRRFFKQMAYLSDSRRLWGAPDVYAFFRERPRSQLLVHPLWYHERELTRREAFEAIRTSVDRLVSARLAAMNALMEEDERRLLARDVAAGR
jgi:peptidoglycan/xylan/chitin deacetylase (PgdA/CDA1 family)